MFSPFQFTEGYTFQYSDILYTYILRASGRICTSLKIASSYHDTCYSTVIIDCYFRSAETSPPHLRKTQGRCYCKPSWSRRRRIVRSLQRNYPRYRRHSHSCPPRYYINSRAGVLYVFLVELRNTAPT